MEEQPAINVEVEHSIILKESWQISMAILGRKERQVSKLIPRKLTLRQSVSGN